MVILAAVGMLLAALALIYLALAGLYVALSAAILVVVGIPQGLRWCWRVLALVTIQPATMVWRWWADRSHQAW